MDDDFVQGGQLAGKSSKDCMEQNCFGGVEGHVCGDGEDIEDV